MNTLSRVPQFPLLFDSVDDPAEVLRRNSPTDQVLAMHVESELWWRMNGIQRRVELEAQGVRLPGAEDSSSTIAAGTDRESVLEFVRLRSDELNRGGWGMSLESLEGMLEEVKALERMLDPKQLAHDEL
jgi:hypothetical protein